MVRFVAVSLDDGRNWYRKVENAIYQWVNGIKIDNSMYSYIGNERFRCNIWLNMAID